MKEVKFLVIGSGLAGLFYALKVSEYGEVIIVTKKNIHDSSTLYAQGGIAGVFSEEDSFEKHKEDTLKAGGGICDEDVVEFIVSEGPGAIEELIELGVEFSRDEDGFDLGMEGGHTARRVLHAKDYTGREIETTLIKNVKSNDNITVLEDTMALDLITVEENEEKRCIGAWVLNKNNEVYKILAPTTLLATGGAGKVYLVTSNPDIATGDGIAMAYRAGASIANMEFVQFHPTCLFFPGAQTILHRSFLISEAVRGEGALLKTRDGYRFMPDYDERAELAPRDIVARAIDDMLNRTGDDCVYLDMKPIGDEKIKERFPNIYTNCRSLGIDVLKEQVPVIPAAHYICGGIRVNLDGETDIKGLYASGETTCTGMHGANRLASNSLLEALVLSRRTADATINTEYRIENNHRKEKTHPLYNKPLPEEFIVISHEWDVIRRVMTNYVGVVRSNKRLDIALNHLKHIHHIVEEFVGEHYPTKDACETLNLTTVAELIIKSAMERKESRGLHYNLDYPEKDDENWNKDTVISTVK